jgi:hypothetical protein
MMSRMSLVPSGILSFLTFAVFLGSICLCYNDHLDDVPDPCVLVKDTSR